MKEATNSYKSIRTLLMYLGFPAEDYWHIDYEIIKESDFENKYFFNLKNKYLLWDGPKDKYGIPLYKGADGKNYYSSIFLGHYGIGAFQEAVESNNATAKKDFLNICTWFLSNQETFQDCEGIWVNRYPMKLYNLSNEWQSCLSQAFGISCLTKAFQLTNENKYLEGANLAAISFYVDIKNGGVRNTFDDSFIFEEYPPSSSVLNGFIFSILSIWDLYKNANTIKSKEAYELLLNESIKSLKINLNKWNSWLWSMYDLRGNPSSYYYHSLHIKQLKIIFTLTKDKYFLQVANAWQHKIKNPIYSILALVYKIFYRI